MTKLIRAYDIIKIPGKKRFDDLNLNEIAIMISASLEPEGNECFAKSALDEFLNVRLKNVELIDTQKAISENVYLPANRSGIRRINEPFLRRMAEKLQQSQDTHHSGK